MTETIINVPRMSLGSPGTAFLCMYLRAWENWRDVPKICISVTALTYKVCICSFTTYGVYNVSFQMNSHTKNKY